MPLQGWLVECVDCGHRETEFFKRKTGNAPECPACGFSMLPVEAQS